MDTASPWFRIPIFVHRNIYAGYFPAGFVDGRSLFPVLSVVVVFQVFSCLSPYPEVCANEPLFSSAPSVLCW
jgi:hypothetical protein